MLWLVRDKPAHNKATERDRVGSIDRRDAFVSGVCRRTRLRAWPSTLTLIRDIARPAVEELGPLGQP
ncbi:hypothetical protein VFPPC_07675 [Pochonia chlamydosporia 170]|uniref:Uncharacterized protein n=1 Tax=Pochonia chlamydosporia 170 TaxID=1380566 RepID=A0A179FKH8_METCM|nr:hypothetical protein VFPPC_07675 [Pochonia chlamydosporia 170]OAQ66064.2 hypothetical protein VFPPC_07675 [Pochonia chlamydosporia 170]